MFNSIFRRIGKRFSADIGCKRRRQNSCSGCWTVHRWVFAELKSTKPRPEWYNITRGLTTGGSPVDKAEKAKGRRGIADQLQLAAFYRRLRSSDCSEDEVFWREVLLPSGF
ncbi:hypothetical protein TWF481_008789 [Arthrobotrys musiformis]|uniref:Uncharacterized protein n=1 Tax=Arthrobotrys musiformis TaxID=47236 RepID=A0AAV9W8C5_9PEZI